jgi:hypothetical protein
VRALHLPGLLVDISAVVQQQLRHVNVISDGSDVKRRRVVAAT